MRRKLWRVGKFVLGLLTAAVAIIQIASWIGAPRSSLVADVSFAPLTLPDALDKQIRGFRDLTSDSVLARGVTREYLDPKLIERYGADYVARLTVAAIARQLSDRLPYGLPEPFRDFRGVWRVAVENRGRRAASGVRLLLPNAIYARIRHEDGTESEGPTSPLLYLNDLAPKEIMVVDAWTDIEPGEFIARSIRLTHDSGLGRVRLSVPTSGAWHWLSENPGTALWLVASVCMFLVSLYSFFRTARPSQPTEAKHAGAD